jgi:P-type conjugative transfer protein TrbJ
MSCRTKAAGAALLALLLLAPVPRAEAQIPVTDVAHIVVNVYHQTIHYVARALEIYQKYQMIYNQYQQLIYQVQALSKLANPNFRDIGLLLTEIDSILGEAESLAYSLNNVNGLFKEIFPGWEEPKDWNAASFAQVRRTLNTLRVGLATVHSHYRYLEEQKAKLEAMKAQILEITGHEQALELQNTIGAFTAEELFLMRQAIATSNNMQSVYFASVVNERAQSQAALQSVAARTAFNYLPPPPGYSFRPQWWPFS